jgi:hypothetical protein
MPHNGIESDPLAIMVCTDCGGETPSAGSRCVCGQAVYCGQDCQRRDWARHKPNCTPFIIRPVPTKPSIYLSQKANTWKYWHDGNSCLHHLFIPHFTLASLYNKRSYLVERVLSLLYEMRISQIFVPCSFKVIVSPDLGYFRICTIEAVLSLRQSAAYGFLSL